MATNQQEVYGSSESPARRWRVRRASIQTKLTESGLVEELHDKSAGRQRGINSEIEEWLWRVIIDLFPAGHDDGSAVGSRLNGMTVARTVAPRLGPVGSDINEDCPRSHTGHNADRSFLSRSPRVGFRSRFRSAGKASHARFTGSSSKVMRRELLSSTKSRTKAQQRQSRGRVGGRKDCQRQPRAGRTFARFISRRWSTSINSLRRQHREGLTPGPGSLRLRSTASKRPRQNDASWRTTTMPPRRISLTSCRTRTFLEVASYRTSSSGSRLR